jgi:mevalonate kinase
VRTVGRGRGKLLLLGEHAAVYGHPAVGLSLDDYVQVDLELSGEPRWRIEGVGSEDREAVLEVLAVCEESLPELQKRGRGRLTLSATIQRGLGFGSSAALCVALSSALHAAIRGMSDGFEGPAGPVWALAHQAERLFHGTPSGIDTGLALLGGLYAFEPRPPELPRAHRLDGFALQMVVGAVPRSTKAGALIGSLRERMLAGDPDTKRRLAALGELAAVGTEILRSGEAGRLEELGGLCWQAGELLGELGLGTLELEALLEEGRAAGALGGKLSGAGGGGAFFLLYASRREAEAGVERLRTLARSLGLPTAETIRAFRWPARGTGAEAGGEAGVERDSS